MKRYVLFSITALVTIGALFAGGRADGAEVVSQGNFETFPTELPDAELIEAMQQGGLVIYIRHASTETDYADQVSADVNDGSTQRVLSEAGWHEAVHIGNAFRFYDIPVGTVYSSQYFRAWQTAWLAFGRYEKRAALNFLPFEDYTDAQVEQMRGRVLPFVSALPPEGVNTVIVAHDDPFEAVSGIYPEPMGIAYVLRPLGDGDFELLGNIPPTGWGWSGIRSAR